ncbi:triose-phosphate transporter [Chloropicon primus]|uniref:Triose-phosphate transporter n=1 Tax=Chloropicon primus TaxID=1764295 RepID=A0A5B8MT27_9CHLO|nr:triose-phosphate transporter [Chloropicon primus]UPR02733.1 triose-phosphate transporter [Chloropicon primus]|eukprot:QDZ23521.1 triose-phosphate transporter [Chloropicon primus]
MEVAARRGRTFQSSALVTPLPTRVRSRGTLGQVRRRRTADKQGSHHTLVVGLDVRATGCAGRAREARVWCSGQSGDLRKVEGVEEESRGRAELEAARQGAGATGNNGASDNNGGAGAEPAGSGFSRRKRQFRGADIARVRVKTVDKRSLKDFALPFGIKLKTLGLGALFLSWYVSNVYFNVFNKRVLNAFPYPGVCTLIHLAVGSLCMAVIWGTRLKKAPQVRASTIVAVLPLGALHLLGFAFTNASLGSVAVSFTHTIKALEPFFTAIFSALILGSIPSLISMLALVPIVSGVMVASFTEASFTWGGLIFALGSNFSFQLRNVLSKQYMTTKAYESQEGGMSTDVLDQVNLFACITITACVLMFPCAYFLDFNRLAAAAGAQGVSAVASKPIGQLLWWSFLAGLCRFADVLVSYAILAQVTPVTHSVGNCLKRVIVIAASIFIFKNPVSSKNVAGTMLAITGVFLYSMTKRLDQQGRRLPFDPIVRKFSRNIQRFFRKPRRAKKKVERGEGSDDKGDDEGKGPLEYYL